MADYNIYLHATEIGGQMNPTTPWGQQGQTNPTTPWGQQGDGSGGYGFQSALGGVAAISGMNPEAIASATISNAASTIPAVAVAAFVVKTVMNVGNTLYTYGANFLAMTTGDYRRKVHLENTKKAIQNVKNPIGTVVNAIKTTLEWDIENRQRTQERALLGDSVINAYTNRGV